MTQTNTDLSVAEQSRNPFSPPSAQVTDIAKPAGSPVKAVLLGLLTDIGGSLVTSIVVVVAFGIFLAATGTARGDMTAKLSAIGTPGSGLYFLLLILGSCCSVLGGYVCARIVRRDEYRITAIMAVITTAVGLLLSWSRHSWLYNLGMAVLSVTLVMLGGHLGALRTRRQQL